MEIIKAKKYENETATVEIHGQIHEIKNPKNGQELEFYGKIPTPTRRAKRSSNTKGGRK